MIPGVALPSGSKAHFGDRFSLAGKRVFVSGASGGIGLNLARLAVEAGAAVALAARRHEKLEEAAASLRREGAQAAAIKLDLTDCASIAPALDEAERSLGGPMDVLVNNAAVLQLARFTDQTVADIDLTLSTNLKGAMLLAQDAARRMVRGNRPGAIINIGSAGALRAGAWTGAYAAAKAGLLHLTQVMALELAPRGIRVNSLCPGNTDTDMIAAIKDSHDAIVRRTPLGRLGQPGDLDGAFLLLASDAGRFMTGANIVVDGGVTLSWM
jgi:NAD(P)-dependent dehydrogenase (short-subunit alcohol dehydrogenase family)